MTSSSPQSAHTRMIFMGASALADGFRLIGFETWPDPTPKDLARLIRELVNNRQKAFVLIDQDLDEADIPILEQVRAGGGYIVLSTVPPLSDPGRFHTRIDDRLHMMLGGAVT